MLHYRQLYSRTGPACERRLARACAFIRRKALFGLHAVESSGRTVLSNEAGGALVLATVVFRQGEPCRRVGGIGDLDRHVVSDDGLSIRTVRRVQIASRTPGHKKGDEDGSLHIDKVALPPRKSIVPEKCCR